MLRVSNIYKSTLNLLARKMHIESIPMRWGSGDNYCYVVIDDATKEATIVDPATPKDVLPTLKKLQSDDQVKLTSITNTHHHYDHSDGNPTFHQMFPNIPIYAGSDSPLVSITPKHLEKHTVGKDIEITALHTPCHTQDSICWFAHDKSTNQRAVFTGDTLFNCGCGRFFEGSADEMVKAMAVLGGLPKDTKVYPGHEYTKSNARFALSVDPKNDALQSLADYTKKNEKTAGVFTIENELEFNPFMRTNDRGLQSTLGTSDEVETMFKLRKLKDNF